jgi:hypothetical protein
MGEWWKGVLCLWKMVNKRLQTSYAFVLSLFSVLPGLENQFWHCLSFQALLDLQSVCCLGEPTLQEESCALYSGVLSIC